MNENETVTVDADKEDAKQCDPLSETGTDQLDEDISEEHGEEQVGEDPLSPEAVEQAPALSSDPLSDLDPDPLAFDEEDGQGELERLRGELRQLREEMAAKQEFFARLEGECAEFCALYPEASISEVSDGVWQDVQRGLPLAAAYALAERRRIMTEKLAAQTNDENRRRSSGALEATDPDYFSPAEVRAMSQAEVRTNYQKIMRSMQKWH